MSWSNNRKSLISSGIKFWVRCRSTNLMLGTQPNNPDIHREFIASRNPEGADPKETAAVELAVNTAIANDQELEDLQMTIFPRATFGILNGKYYDPELEAVPPDATIVNLPFIYDYQFRGSFKESISMLNKADKGKETYDAAGITAYKKAVDGNWFVINRKIPLFIPETFTNMNGDVVNTYDEHGNLRTLSRPLRAETAKGPRTALATSEIVPAGTEFYFGIYLLNEDNLKACLETLDYKALMGMLQWRGGGKGTLDWTLCNKNGVPYDELDEDQLSIEDKIIIAKVTKAIGDDEVTKFGNAFLDLIPKKAPKEDKLKRGRKAAAKSGDETPAEADGAAGSDESGEDASEPAPKKRGRKASAKAED